jgi:hypothetical protein
MQHIIPSQHYLKGTLYISREGENTTIQRKTSYHFVLKINVPIFTFYYTNEKKASMVGTPHTQINIRQFHLCYVGVYAKITLLFCGSSVLLLVFNTSLI